MARDPDRPPPSFGIARRDLLGMAGACALWPWTTGESGGWLSAQAATQTENTSVDSEGLAALFVDPPHRARPGVYWYWMNGNVTREGITADLEAMKAAGISTVMLFSVGGEGPDTVVRPAAPSLTPYWWSLVRFAVAEAARLGLEMALNACDGWATASGPWITPELSMQRLCWSEVALKDRQRFRGVVPRPPTMKDYYRDLRVVAYPHPAEWLDTGLSAQAQVSGTLAGANADRLMVPDNNDVVVDSDEAGDLVFAFPRPFTLRSVTVRTPPFPGPFAGVQRAANSLIVEASDDGVTYRPVGRLDYVRHGWETDLTALTHAVQPTRARWFRFTHRPQPAPAYREDRHHAGDGTLRLTGLLLSARPRIPALPARTGEKWAIAAPIDDTLVPESDCIAPGAFVDLTPLMASDGTLDWKPPRGGAWTILRIGYTSTGKSNSIAGAGQGLECDKLSKAAAKVQFDSWYGKALDHVGPELAGKVLHIFHVDSWEAGSQNWTPGFEQAFAERRGYSLLDQLPLLTGTPIASAEHSERVFFDLRRTIAEMVTENFFGEMAQLCAANGCIFSGETVNPTMIADGLDFGRHLDVPMGEFWFRTPQNHKPSDIMEAVSAAHVYGRPVAGAEAFTEWELKWDETPALLKTRGDEHYAAGINRFYLHVYAMQPWLDRAPGVTLSGVGTFFSRTQTWWKQGRAWFDYMARSQALLQAGSPVTDVAMFIGEDIPARGVIAEDVPFVLSDGLRYDSINRDALLRLAEVRAGVLVLPGGARYRALVLPAMPRITVELAEKLLAFARAGLPLVGVAPKGSAGGIENTALDARVQRALVGIRFHPYREAAKVLGTPRLTAAGGLPGAVSWISRAGARWTLHYFTNQGDASHRLDLALAGQGRAQIWNPVDGTRTPALARPLKDGRTAVTLPLGPRQALFVVIVNEPKADLVAALSNGATLGGTIERPLLLSEGGAVTVTRAASGARQYAVPALPKAPVLTDWRLSIAGRPAQRWSGPDRWDKSDDAAIRHFSGTAIYHARLQMPAAALRPDIRWMLDLGNVHDIAEVTVNGRRFAPLWTTPFAVEIGDALKPGTNSIDIAVTNTWFNRLVGDAGKDADQRTTFVTPRLHFGKLWQPTGKEQLLPAGLDGVAQLRPVAVRSL